MHTPGVESTHGETCDGCFGEGVRAGDICGFCHGEGVVYPVKERISPPIRPVGSTSHVLVRPPEA